MVQPRTGGRSALFSEHIEKVVFGENTQGTDEGLFGRNEKVLKNLSFLFFSNRTGGVSEFDKTPACCGGVC